MSKTESQKPKPVDAEKFTEIVRKLVNTGPIKREDVKVEKRKPAKVIRPSG